MSVNLNPRHTYYEYSVWVLKLGVTEWYQSRVNRRNTSLVRRVIFWRLFYNYNYFYSIPLQTSSSLLIFPTIFFISAPALENGFTYFLQIFPKKIHLQVYIIASKHLNEVWRYNEGHTKDEASLSSRLEGTFGWRDRRVHSHFTTSQDGDSCTSSLRHSQQGCWLGVVALC
jgi:hypothetical protein